MTTPRPFGVDRVVAPSGAMPQSAERIDPSGDVRPGEIHIHVDTLNIDSASFAQIVGEVGDDPDTIGAHVAAIVAARGKMQNPVTGSGGMLLGTVAARAEGYDAHPDAHVGARVATLVSLTLTPLRIDRVRSVHVDADQVAVDGHAFLPASAPLVVIPDDLPERLALACLDVCGAPAQVARLAAPGARVAIIGAGKSGALCMAQARASVGPEGRVVAVDLRPGVLPDAERAGLIDAQGTCDARDPLATYDTVTRLLGGAADLVVNTANVDGTEMSAILCARDGGTVYFFNMATSFARAALGAEGVGKDATLIIGNGYAPGHAALTLELVRSVPFVRDVFERAVAT